MLEVKHLSVAYGQHRALDDVSVQIAKGEVVVILGANGAGKSSLLRAIAGLSEGHCEGDISFEGSTILGTTPDDIVTGGIALVPEGRAIFGDLNVEENLRLGAYNDRARANEAANLDRVLTLFPKLRERRRQITRTMSGGEQQMVAIGRALMSDPSILMLDEPSLGLSPLLSKELFQALGRIRESGPGVLVVEQNAKLSLAIADRGYLIENGHIVGANDAASLSADPAVQAAYLGGSSSGGGLGKGTPRTRVLTAAPASGSMPGTTAGRTYVRPSGLTATSATTSSLIGENLDGLLGRASEAAQQRPQAKVAVPKSPSGGGAIAPSPSPSPRVIEVRPDSSSTSSSTSMAVPAQTGAGAASRQSADGDDRIASMLAEFEEAATRARQPRGSGSHQQAEGQAQPAPGAEPPHIPVFRKSRVEVFKRDGSGALVKSREV